MTTLLLERIDAVLLAESRVRRERALAPLERRLARRVADVFRLQQRALLRRLAAYRSLYPTPLREALSAADWEPLLSGVFAATQLVFRRALAGVLGLAARLGATTTLGDLGVSLSFSLANPRAVAWLRAHAAERVTLIDDATRDQLRDLLVRAGAEGWAYTRTTKEIRATFAGFTRERAQLIAVHEAGEAYQHGNLMAAQEVADTGTAMEKAWQTAEDDRVEPECRANAAAGWIGLGDAFPSGHQRPLAHPRCRCALLTRSAG
jgi:hypothetical protein